MAKKKRAKRKNPKKEKLKKAAQIVIAIDHVTDELNDISQAIEDCLGLKKGGYVWLD
jgi:hypothetical protein